ncbi:DUF262 domain-containing protein [Fictibacillus terranigra]|uniref:DUF262 domain-containing protein n=1 Tax=Fictibacillus terranigra TaxID=3058424 RepID=UPI00338DE8B9
MWEAYVQWVLYSLLIESILLNIPIPVIYASEEEDNRWNIVDGLQRLTALRRFFDNNFRLSGLQVLSELNGMRFRIKPQSKKSIKQWEFKGDFNI